MNWRYYLGELHNTDYAGTNYLPLVLSDRGEDFRTRLDLARAILSNPGFNYAIEDVKAMLKISNGQSGGPEEVF